MTRDDIWCRFAMLQHGVATMNRGIIMTRIATHTCTVYTITELARKHPDAYQKAYERWKERQDEIPLAAEICDSMKAVCEAAGLKIDSWSVGICDRHTHIRLDWASAKQEDWIDDDCIKDLSGPRAMAWIENRLLSDLRIPWTGPKRWNVANCGRYYRPGMIEPCPLTGVCFDAAFLDHIVNGIRGGRKTLGDVFGSLDSVAEKLMENEWDAAISEERFREECDDLEREFTENGREWTGE